MLYSGVLGTVSTMPPDGGPIYPTVVSHIGVQKGRTLLSIGKLSRVQTTNRAKLYPYYRVLLPQTSSMTPLRCEFTWSLSFCHAKPTFDNIFKSVQGIMHKASRGGWDYRGNAGHRSDA